jgi:hypothetical protein
VRILILEKAVEKATGEAVNMLRARSIEETRRVAEKRHKRPFKFTSRFPFIGRGNVLRDRVVSHDEVERGLDEVLRDR